MNPSDSTSLLLIVVIWGKKKKLRHADYIPRLIAVVAHLESSPGPAARPRSSKQQLPQHGKDRKGPEGNLLARSSESKLRDR
jgi:hypothetical protein